MSSSTEISDLIDYTPFVDTHEHLFEESKRLDALESRFTEPVPVAAPDVGLLFSHYSEHDLQCAGMDPEHYAAFTSYEVEPRDKWKLIEPYYKRAYHTGYLRSIRESIRALYDEEDITDANVESLSEQIRSAIQPGDYLPVELVPGHAKIARQGLAQAVSELVDEGWIAPKEVEGLVERLMRGNAHEAFDYEGTLENWRQPENASTGEAVCS